MAIERSNELLAISRRWMRAYGSGDADSMVNLILPSEAASVIGTDAVEWWLGFSVVEGVARAQAAEIQGTDFVETDAQAWTSGDTGWVLAKYHASVPTGFEMDMRITIVFVLDRGQWRIAHAHASVGQANEQTLGLTLTTSIDQLVDAVVLERPAIGASSIDGLVTVVFSDIESSTEVAERMGDEAWLSLLRRYDSAVRDVVALNRGKVVKSMGDGYMLVFPSARLGLSCALDLQLIDVGARTRVGVHAGEAVRDADDFFGHSVTLAARVAASAEGGEVLASDVVRQLVAGFREFDFTEPRTAELKGIPGEHTLHRVRRRDAAASVA